MDGTDSTAGLALAPHELLRAFSAKTLARGETYANQGRVATARYEPLDGTLAGTCLGSKGEYYEVEVALSGPRTNLEIEYAVCTCPVGRYCKHAVAMLMAAIPSAPDRAAPQRWQVVLGSLLDEMTAPDADTGGKPLALEFGMLPAGRYHLGQAGLEADTAAARIGRQICRNLSKALCHFKAAIGPPPARDPRVSPSVVARGRRRRPHSARPAWHWQE